MGLDAVSHDNPEFFGMIGSYGNRYSNLTLANSDFLLILGSRLDSGRPARDRIPLPAPQQRSMSISIRIELNAKVQVDLALQCQIKPFLHALNEKLADDVKPDLAAGTGLSTVTGRSIRPDAPGESAMIDPNLLHGDTVRRQH